MIGQASSSRKIDQVNLEVEVLAHRSLHRVATFASACLHNCSAEVVKITLKSWWKESGHELLLAFGDASHDSGDEADGVNWEIETSPCQFTLKFLRILAPPTSPTMLLVIQMFQHQGLPNPQDI